MKETSRLSKKTSKTNFQRISRMYSKEKGITLIALVITIIILIILATVTLNVVLGEGGLIDRAQQAKELTEQAALEEQQGLNSLMSEYANIMAEDQNPPIPKSEVEEAKESGTPFEDTTTITDDLDNEVTIPGEFHIAEDSGTKVEEGIVIEDGSGNQFVWIPVGEYNVTENVEKITEPGTQDGKLTNELSRRTFTENGSTLVNGDDALAGPLAEEYNEYYYGEGNSKVEDPLEGFKTSSITNKGFYIGRYETGSETEITSQMDIEKLSPVVQPSKYPFTHVTLGTATIRADRMYQYNNYVTSRLANSYAWDTALNFICQTNKEGYLLAVTTDSDYGNINTQSVEQTGEYKVTGKESDKYSNIYDMLGNCKEWTGELFSNNLRGETIASGVTRGGSYSDSNYSAIRIPEPDAAGDSYENLGFRIVLYLQ